MRGWLSPIFRDVEGVPPPAPAGSPMSMLVNIEGYSPPQACFAVWAHDSWGHSSSSDYVCTPTPSEPVVFVPEEVAIEEHLSERGEATVLDRLIFDLDGDSESEALVLASYPKENYGSTGVALLLDWDGSTCRAHWFGEIEMPSVERGSITWQDLNADGHNEIVLVLEGFWSPMGGYINLVQSLLIFAYRGGETVELGRVVPSHIIPVISIQNVDDDPALEIVLDEFMECPEIRRGTWRVPPWIGIITTYDWNGQAFEVAGTEVGVEGDYACLCQFVTSLRGGDYQGAFGLTAPHRLLSGREISTVAEFQRVIEEQFAELIDPRFRVWLAQASQLEYQPSYFILESVDTGEVVARYAVTLEEVDGAWRVVSISRVTD